LIIKSKNIKFFAKVDFLTNQVRWKNGVFGLVFPLDFR